MLIQADASISFPFFVFALNVDRFLQSLFPTDLICLVLHTEIREKVKDKTVRFFIVEKM